LRKRSTTRDSANTAKPHRMIWMAVIR
jgi:hypothetical protein